VVRKTNAFPGKRSRFAGGSNSSAGAVVLYCSVLSRNANGVFREAFTVRWTSDTWESAMGQGTNTDMEQADQWAYGRSRNTDSCDNRT